MSVVILVSGGVDSTLMTMLAVESGLRVDPLFIDYGQRARDRELDACRSEFKRHGLPAPTILSIGGFGTLVSSGLTDAARDVFLDAFLPGRNLLFLLAAAAYGYQRGATAVAIGLLSEESSIFPDQKKVFLAEAEKLISIAIDRKIAIITPLMEMTKSDVVALARQRGVVTTYSCHVGGSDPCGECVACREFEVLGRHDYGR